MSDKLKLFRENTYVTKEFNDYLENLAECLSSTSYSVAIEPATDVTEFTEDEFDAGVTLDVTIQIHNDKNEVAKFFNGARTIDLVNGSSNFTLQIDDEDAGGAGANVTGYELDFVDGEGKFKITVGGTWEANQNVTLRVDNADDEKVLGFSIKEDAHVIIKSAAA